MAGRNSTDNIDLATSDMPARVYSGAQEQARFVLEGRWDAIDRENVAEQIESLGRSEFNTLENALRVLLLHMLNGIISRTGADEAGRCRLKNSGTGSLM
jgi:hypothetical protein